MSAQSSSVSAIRRPRARLLVVVSSPEAREFASLARKHIDAVSESPNFYDAIAEIGIAGDRNPIVAVAFMAGCDGHSPTEVLRAIEKVDVSVASVLLYPRGDDQSAMAMAEGFEDTIPIPAKTDDIVEVFTGLGLIDLPPGKHADPAELEIETIRRNDSERVVESVIARARANAHAHPESPIENTAPAPEAPTPRAELPHDEHPRLEHPRPEHPRPELPRDEHPRDEHPRDPSAVKFAERPSSAAPAPMPSHLPSTRDVASPRETKSETKPEIRAEMRAETRAEMRAEMRAHAKFGTKPEPKPEARTEGKPETHFSAEQIAEIVQLRDRALLRALKNRESVRDVALVLLRHTLQANDIRFASPARPGEERSVARDREGVHEAPVHGKKSLHGILLSRTIESARLGAWASWLAEWLDHEEDHGELHRLATVDELTGALNRRALATMLPSIIERARTERRPVSLMYFDIDDFKMYNDRHGHAAGDEVLRESIAALRDSIRKADLVFRMGGDEFVVVFCDPDPPRRGGSGVPEHVEEIAERCRAAVRRLHLPVLADSGPGPVTISAGCAVFPWDRDATDASGLLALADMRALEAKRLGKDQIYFGPNHAGGGSAV